VPPARVGTKTGDRPSGENDAWSSCTIGSAKSDVAVRILTHLARRPVSEGVSAVVLAANPLRPARPFAPWAGEVG